MLSQRLHQRLHLGSAVSMDSPCLIHVWGIKNLNWARAFNRVFTKIILISWHFHEAAMFSQQITLAFTVRQRSQYGFNLTFLILKSHSIGNKYFSITKRLEFFQNLKKLKMKLNYQSIIYIYSKMAQSVWFDTPFEKSCHFCKFSGMFHVWYVHFFSSDWLKCLYYND